MRACITEKYMRRYPTSKKTKAWNNALVHLYTRNGIWRDNGKGYTAVFSEAWVLPLEDARTIVAGIYEDHGGTYYSVTTAVTESAEDILNRINAWPGPDENLANSLPEKRRKMFDSFNKNPVVDFPTEESEEWIVSVDAAIQQGQLVTLAQCAAAAALAVKRK